MATDTSGNMTRVPKPDDWSDDYQLTYDAWNRLVKVEQDDGAGGTETVARYEYDGRNFRVVKKTYDGGVLAEMRHFYYTDDWQCLEERVDTATDPDIQYVWGIRYVDDLVLRDRDTSSPRDGTLDERLYSLADPNFNVVALAETDGDVVERYTYTAYGQATILTPAFATRATTSYAWHYRYTTRRNAKSPGRVEAEAGEGGAGPPLDSFGGCPKGFAWRVEQAEDGQSGVGQRRERLSQAGPLGVVAIFVPPAVLDEMEAVFHLPVAANGGLEFTRRDRIGLQAGDEVPAFAGKERALRRAH